MDISDGRSRFAAGLQSQERVLRPGLSFHVGADHHYRDDYEGEAIVDDYMRIVLVLEGSLDLNFGPNPVKLQAAGARNAAMVTMLEPASFRRVVRRGESSRRISIGLARGWVDDALGDAAASEAGRHLETALWTASPRARMLVEQMLAPPPLLAPLVKLYQESRVIELVIEAMSMSMGVQVGRLAQAGTQRRLPPAVQRRICELKDWLRANAAQPLRLEQIANQLHTTPSTLQRHFRLVHGMSVFDFLQQERLSQARQALERDGISVGQAAAMAGYANATSFATAFRRQFGLSPRQARTHAGE